MRSDQEKESLYVGLVLAALGFIGTVLALVGTSRYGAGISSDSTQYISAARSLLAGTGYRVFDGSLYVQWPPLFPTLLAAVSLIGVDASVGARFLNALAFGLSVFFSGQLFFRCIKSKAFVILGCISVLLAMPLLQAGVMVWTEPIFCMFSVLFLLFILKWLEDRKTASLLLVALVSSLAILQRYVGIAFAISGGLVLLMLRDMPLLNKAKHLIVFTPISILPIAIWFSRNYFAVGSLGGPALPSRHSLSGVAYQMLDVLSTWLLPRGIPVLVRVLCLVVTCICLSLLVARNKLVMGGSRKVVPFMIFVLAYLSVIAISALSVWVDIDDRTMVPIFVAIVLLALMAIEIGLEPLSVLLSSKSMAHSLVISLCMLWLVYPSLTVVHDIVSWRQNGPGGGGFSTTAWMESPLMHWLETHSLDGQIYSNTPDAIYAVTGITAQYSPFRSASITHFRESLPSGQANYLVWSNTFTLEKEYLHDLQELRQVLELEELASFPDGVIYQLKSPKSASYSEGWSGAR